MAEEKRQILGSRYRQEIVETYIKEEIYDDVNYYGLRFDAGLLLT
jgi:hypothetical protein